MASLCGVEETRHGVSLQSDVLWRRAKARLYGSWFICRDEIHPVSKTFFWNAI